jgi:hypothetical protein
MAKVIDTDDATFQKSNPRPFRSIPVVSMIGWRIRRKIGFQSSDQRRKIPLRRLPNNIQIDVIIIVYENVSHRRYESPRYLRKRI